MLEKMAKMIKEAENGQVYSQTTVSNGRSPSVKVEMAENVFVLLCTEFGCYF